jgi:hypothetical protein
MNEVEIPNVPEDRLCQTITRAFEDSAVKVVITKNNGTYNVIATFP